MYLQIIIIAKTRINTPLQMINATKIKCELKRKRIKENAIKINYLTKRQKLEKKM